MFDLDSLVFDESGLIPAIVVDVETGAVLTLAYMNRESLQISIDEGRTCFWSRSRNEIWRKGETSGNVQHIVGITTDCDNDALVVTVRKIGPACHTGAESCFFGNVYRNSTEPGEPFSLNTLHEIIKDRKLNKKSGSYTTYLFEKGLDKILKKLGEESTEIIIAAKSGDKAETIYEISDFIYHALVLMSEMNITPDEVLNELASRHCREQGTGDREQ